jgi:gas vesicle protein
MEERMKVLKMLESGKIKAEEAVKLLDALKDPEIPHRSIVIKGMNEVMESISNIMKDVSRTIGETVKEKMKEAEDAAKDAKKRVKRAAKELKK